MTRCGGWQRPTWQIAASHGARCRSSLFHVPCGPCGCKAAHHSTSIHACWPLPLDGLLSCSLSALWRRLGKWATGYIAGMSLGELGPGPIGTVGPPERGLA